MLRRSVLEPLRPPSLLTSIRFCAPGPTSTLLSPMETEERYETGARWIAHDDGDSRDVGQFKEYHDEGHNVDDSGYQDDELNDLEVSQTMTAPCHYMTGPSYQGMLLDALEDTDLVTEEGTQSQEFVGAEVLDHETEIDEQATHDNDPQILEDGFDEGVYMVYDENQDDFDQEDEEISNSSDMDQDVDDGILQYQQFLAAAGGQPSPERGVLEYQEIQELIHDDSMQRNSPFFGILPETFKQPEYISADDVHQGIDSQGIVWDRDLHLSREDCRAQRIMCYQNYYNYRGQYKGPTTTPRYSPQDSFLDFVEMSTCAKPGQVHFQLRNLLSAVDKNHVYFTTPSNVSIYTPAKRLYECALLLPSLRAVAPFPMQAASLAVTKDYLALGGFFGEFALKTFPYGHERSSSIFDSDEESGDIFVGRVTTDLQGITNHISPQVTRTGRHSMTISSNDKALRNFDIESRKTTKEIKQDWAVNCSATSTDKRLCLVVGDDCSALILDAERGDRLQTIDGHFDFNFACAWSPDGHTFATGSQDMTTRLYDARNTRWPLEIYRAQLGAIRSLKFSQDGRFLAVAEPADFVHIADMRNTNRLQVLDFFGEVSGIDWTEDGTFFVGNSDKQVGGVMEYVLHDEHFDIGSCII